MLIGQVAMLLSERKQGILGNPVRHSRTQCVLCLVFSSLFSFSDHRKYWTSDLFLKLNKILAMCEALGVAHSVHALGAIHYRAFCIVGAYCGASFCSK